jgi:uncharacterized membrane protein
MSVVTRLHVVSRRAGGCETLSLTNGNHPEDKGGTQMSELIVAGFKGEFAADEVLLDMFKLEQIHLLDLEDAAVASRKKDGTLKIRHTNILPLAEAATGSGVGLLIGTMLLNPIMCTLIGGVVGAALGETVKILKDIGIKDEFIRDIGETLKPNHSAIFILIRESVPEKIVEELAKYKAKLLRTTLSPTKEAELNSILLDNVTLKKGPPATS